MPAKTKSKDNIFTNAPKVRMKKPGAPQEAATIEIEGVEPLAAVRVLKNALEEAEVNQNNLVTAKVIQEFKARGGTIGARPKNFTAIDGEAEASCQLQSRGEKRVLNDEEIKLFKSHKIPFRTVTVQEPVYFIPPEFSRDQALLAKVHEALSTIPDLPKGFIQQLHETRSYVTDHTIDAVFARVKSDPELAEKLIPLVTTPAIKTTLDVGFERAWEIAKDIVPKPLDPHAPREPWSATLTTKSPVKVAAAAKRVSGAASKKTSKGKSTSKGKPLLKRVK
jgi:hypothetical protein